MEANPLLPVEEDGRLCDPILRENFVLRVFAYHDWQQLCARGITAAALIRFHSRYKYLVLSHATTHYRTLGKLLGNLGKANLQEVADSYIKGLMAALTLRANRRSHTNVLMHLQGYFKRVLTPAQKQELCDTIDKYRTGVFPLLVQSSSRYAQVALRALRIARSALSRAAPRYAQVALRALRMARSALSRAASRYAQAA